MSMMHSGALHGLTWKKFLIYTEVAQSKEVEKWFDFEAFVHPITS